MLIDIEEELSCKYYLILHFLDFFLSKLESPGELSKRKLFAASFSYYIG